MMIGTNKNECNGQLKSVIVERLQKEKWEEIDIDNTTILTNRRGTAIELLLTICITNMERLAIFPNTKTITLKMSFEQLCIISLGIKTALVTRSVRVYQQSRTYTHHLNEGFVLCLRHHWWNQEQSSFSTWAPKHSCYRFQGRTKIRMAMLSSLWCRPSFLPSVLWL